jgi:hypothetical protein
MTGSAKQSIARSKKEWIASSLSLLAMTATAFFAEQIVDQALRIRLYCAAESASLPL